MYMAVKTITIDMEAYTLLAAEKRPEESFSRVIRRRLRPDRTARRLLEALPKCALASDSLNHLEKLVRARAEATRGSPILNLPD
jgi:predicted CopG family antitoxin